MTETEHKAFAEVSAIQYFDNIILTESGLGELERTFLSIEETEGAGEYSRPGD